MVHTRGDDANDMEVGGPHYGSNSRKTSEPKRRDLGSYPLRKMTGILLLPIEDDENVPPAHKIGRVKCSSCPQERNTKILFLSIGEEE